MLEDKRPKAILLDSNDLIRQTARLILEKQGWHVTCEEVSKEALTTLKKAEHGPFALFISNYRLPKMEGDDILTLVKKISPLTQRMLMVSEAEPEILISAINRSVVDSCISAPFQEEDLVKQSRACFRSFKREIKRRRLKRITRHQNKQLFRVAQKLKKKARTFKEEIEEKKKAVLKLRAEKRGVKQKKEGAADITIDTYMNRKNLAADPDSFLKGFLDLSQPIHTLFENIRKKEGLPPFEPDISRIFQKNQSSEPETEPLHGNNGQQTDSRAADEDDAPAGSHGQTTSLPPVDPDLLEQIIRHTLTRKATDEDQTAVPAQADDKAKVPLQGNETALDTYLDLEVSECQTQATVRQKDGYDPELAPDMDKIQKWLSDKLISYGIMEDAPLEAWLNTRSKEKIIIAKGIKPVLPTPGTVTYHFKSDFTNPGKINEDGTIDFKDRGRIPFVQKDTLLAERIPARQGTAGISISSMSLPVEEVEDAVMTPGPGVRLSEDGLRIYAEIEGQPHADAMGTVSVSPDLVIRGDVGFETGNINFNGNIIVSGMVKEGFSVKGINLTVQEVEGAIIDLTGDLNVSAGITESHIQVQGNVRAKFVNDSSLKGFGDVNITKEIIDSRIMISGKCLNDTGHIIASTISAKRGIEAGNIGTATSKPSVLKVGVDEFAASIKKQLEEKLERSINKVEQLKDEIQKLEEEDQTLYEMISHKAHIQDRAQIDIRQLEKQLPDIEKSNDRIKLKKAADLVKKLTLRAKQAEHDLNEIFEKQDRIAGKISALKEQISLQEKINRKTVLQKKALKEFEQKAEPVASVSVSRTVCQDTTIKGPHASLIIREDRSRCRISEIKASSDTVNYHELVITDK